MTGELVVTVSGYEDGRGWRWSVGPTRRLLARLTTDDPYWHDASGFAATRWGAVRKARRAARQVTRQRRHADQRSVVIL